MRVISGHSTGAPCPTSVTSQQFQHTYPTASTCLGKLLFLSILILATEVNVMTELVLELIIQQKTKTLCIFSS